MKKSLLLVLSGIALSANVSASCPNLIGSYTCSEIVDVIDIDGNVGRESNSEEFKLDIVTKLNAQGVAHVMFNSSYADRFDPSFTKSYFKPFVATSTVATAEIQLSRGSKATSTQCISDTRAGDVITQDETYISNEAYAGKHSVNFKEHFMRIDGDILRISTKNTNFDVPSDLMGDLNVDSMLKMVRFDKSALTDQGIIFDTTTDQLNCIRN